MAGDSAGNVHSCDYLFIRRINGNQGAVFEETLWPGQVNVVIPASSNPRLPPAPWYDGPGYTDEVCVTPTTLPGYNDFTDTMICSGRC